MAEAVSVRKLVRLFCAAGVSLFAVWALWPPSTDRQVLDAAPEASAAKYVIKFFPGFQYMPGSLPHGMGKPLRGVTEVLRDFEKNFPDTHVEVVSAPSAVREYLVTQLSTSAAPDIIMTTVEDVWPDIQKDWYVPLDAYLEAPNPFVEAAAGTEAPAAGPWWDLFKYQAISRAKAAPDGRYYTITFDLVETGIFYNKTLFHEIGVGVPETWEEFLGVLGQIRDYEGPESRKYTPLLLHIDAVNGWAVELVFDQIYYGILPGIDLFQDPTRGEYMQGYLDWDELVFLHEKGLFSEGDPRYVAIWPILHDLAQYANKNLLGDVGSGSASGGQAMVRDFLTGRGAMLWDISAFAYRLSVDPSIDFEWDVFYLPPFTKATTEFASGVPMCVVGGPATSYAVTNSAVGDTDPALSFEERIANSTRLKRVIALLQFLTAPENYARIVNEYPCFMPNIAGVEALPLLQPFEETFKRRYTTTKWIYTFDLKFSEVQRRMLQLYLCDGISLDEFLHDWQIPNVTAACERAKRRQRYDPSELEEAWDRLAPVRAAMPGLPR